jgi:hypothetical protein
LATFGWQVLKAGIDSRGFVFEEGIHLFSGGPSAGTLELGDPTKGFPADAPKITRILGADFSTDAGSSINWWTTTNSTTKNPDITVEFTITDDEGKYRVYGLGA